MEVCITYIRQLVNGLRQNPPDTPRHIKTKDELQLLLATIGIVVAVILGPVSE